jgi:hypothetical protein
LTQAKLVTALSACNITALQRFPGAPGPTAGGFVEKAKAGGSGHPPRRLSRVGFLAESIIYQGPAVRIAWNGEGMPFLVANADEERPKPGG